MYTRMSSVGTALDSMKGGWSPGRGKRATQVRASATIGVTTALCLLTGGVAEADSYPVSGPDTSHHNHSDGKAFDWSAIAGSQKFISLKATQGTKFVDPWFARDLAGAKSVKLIRTAYHFFTAGEDGTAQADHFLRATGAQGLTGRGAYELPLALDLEECTRGGKQLQLIEVQKFLARVTQVTGVNPTIYTRKAFIDSCLGGTSALGTYRVWLARYNTVEPLPIPGGTGWSFWQYTDKAQVAGIPGAVDHNYFRLSYASLKRLAHVR